MHASRSYVGAAIGFFCLTSACTGSESAPTSEVQETNATFQELNGVMWFYTTVNDTKYQQLGADLDRWKERGIRTIGIYSPYRGEKDQWLGAGPVDYYSVPEQNGTLDDFRNLVASAHAKDMKVIAFMGFHSIDERSQFFQTAEAEFRDGDRTSPEVSAFEWTDDPSVPTPTPAPMGPSVWKKSDVANAYYWGLWDNAGFDVNLPGAVTEMERAMRFWLEVGLDGFMLDSGVVDPAFRSLWVDVPLSYKSDFWLTFESTWSEEAAQFDDFGLTSWFAFEDNDYANTYSLVVFPEEGETPIDADELEEQLSHVDQARAKGKLTHAWSILERSYPDDRMRVQEAALLAGAGVLYGAPMYDESYMGWPESVRADWEKVLATVNDSRALHPSASRTRVAADGTRVYAMLRTTNDGTESALLVYNFDDHDATVAIDLAGTGVAIGQSPLDLYGSGDAVAITSTTYSLSLPAYGFALLGVSRSVP